MSETNGGNVCGGAEGEQPKHAAAQGHDAPRLDDGFMEAMAGAADEYRFDQLRQQYEAEYAIERMQLFVDFAGKERQEDRQYIDAQRQLIAESIGRQAAASAYADSLRERLYYAPPDDNYYHGRHRLEDRLGPQEQEVEGGGEDPVEPPAPAPPPTLLEAEPTPDVPELPSLRFQAPPGTGRLRHNIDEDPPDPPPINNPPPQDPSSVVPQPREKVGVLNRLRHAYYAGLAVAAECLTLPERIWRHRTVRTVVVATGIAAVGLAVWLGPDLSNPPPPQETHATQPAGPPPNTEAFFDNIRPGNYHGEPFEWSAAANHSSPSQATPELLRLIDYARDNGLKVDTWGNPAQGDWGINSVTVKLPNGAQKSYYETADKLAIMQWYAGGAGPSQS